MSRLSALAAHPRRTVGALAVVLAAVGITVGSGANFTAHSANPSNTFTAGTLSIDNSRGNGSSATAILTAPNLKPGDSAPGTVDIQNSGSVAGNFTLKVAGWKTGYTPSAVTTATYTVTGTVTPPPSPNPGGTVPPPPSRPPSAPPAGGGR